MKNKILFLFVVLFLSLIIINVSAEPPVLQTTTVQNTGLILEYPPYDSIKYEQNFSYSFHVFNSTNGLPMNNASIKCNLDIYFNGQKISSLKNLYYNNQEWIVYLNKNNFTNYGRHHYISYCNNSDTGGYTASIFYVTSGGNYTQDGLVISLSIIFFIFIISLLIFTLIDMIAHVFSLDYDAIDAAKNIGLYFAVLGFYVMNNQYLGDNIINSWLELLIKIGAFTHVVIPILSFALMMIIGQYIKKRLYNP
jgi:hypothetical protein